MSKKRALIIDLDGTLCNADHRLHHIKKEPKDWDTFFSECHKDEPNWWCQKIIYNFMRDNYKILYVTGRSNRQETLDWLFRHLHEGSETDIEASLFTRERTDRRHDYVFKEEVYRTQIEPHYEVLFAIDDKKGVIDMWRRLGITALHCSGWEENAEANHSEAVLNHFVSKLEVE